MNSDSEVGGRSNPLRRRLRRATSDAILVAAEEVFAEHGLHSARMEDIARRAGVSVGTLYNYFDDRSALLAALLALRRAGLLAALDRAAARGESQPFEVALARLLAVLLEHYEAHRKFLSILMEGEVARDAQAFPGAASLPRTTMRAIHARFAALVNRGVAAGVLRVGSAALYPSMLMGMIRGAVIHSLFEPPLARPTERVAELTEFFMRGAAQPNVPGPTRRPAARPGELPRG